MTEHSIIGPSQAYRWMNCSGSPFLTSLHPKQQEGEAAKRGTMMHAAANGLPKTGLTEEEIAIVDGYWKVLPTTTKVEQERRVGGLIDAEYYNVHPMHFGTLDAVWYEDNQTHVLDLKTGKWPVPAKNNWQLIGYAAELTGGRNFALGIYQPKVSKKVDWWRLTWVEIEPLIARYKAAANRVFDNPTLTPGEWCKFCPAAGPGGTCEKLRAVHAPSLKDW